MVCEMSKSSKEKNSHDAGDDTNQNNSQTEEFKGGESNSRGIGDVDNGRFAKSRTGLKQRPLLLHATIANTIYLGRRWPRGGGRKKKIYTFDASELLARFGGGDVPETHNGNQPHQRRDIPRNRGKGKQKYKEGQLEAAVGIEGEQDLRKPQVKTPFIWAHDIPLDRLCICEMGAKPVPHDESQGGPILGEAYKIVAERSLNITLSAGRRHEGPEVFG